MVSLPILYYVTEAFAGLGGTRMEYRQLGLTGISASTLGFGMWPIGGTQHAGDYGVVSTDEAIGAIHRALDLGVTLFDTEPPWDGWRLLTLEAKTVVPDLRTESRCVQWIN